MDTKQNRKTEEILNSLDGLNKAAAPDFFYTRLKAKMTERLEGDTKKTVPGKHGWALRPAYAVAAMVVVLVCNSVVLLQKNRSGATATGTNDTEIFQSIAAEYSINDNNSLYDLTQD